MPSTPEALAPSVANGQEPPHAQKREYVVEIVSDAGEGAQKAGQSFGTISAKMSNGVWTVEIIPAEIQPPRAASPGPLESELELDPST
ncbi:MAG: 2-oxoglutarate ferredoxin oxidoreductase subunit alpha [Rhodothermales bacterium]|jgi:2-oxoglutarate ferredoxin oxidoreductase subunit alpha